jgi:predicted RNase H-like nuclease (RuvC/YqgF family)
MEDDAIDKLSRRINQTIGILEKLKDENSNLKSQIATMEDEIYKLRDEAKILKDEREQIKIKVDSATSMLDRLNLEEEIN